MMTERYLKGFTLIELLLVIGILVIFSVLSLPNLAGTYNAYLLKTSAENMASWIRYTQGRAVAKHLVHQLNLSEKQYWITEADPESDAFVSVQGKLGRIQNIPQSIVVENPGVIEFDPEGWVSAARIYLCLKEQCYTVSTQEQSGSVEVYDYKVEESFLEEEES